MKRSCVWQTCGLKEGAKEIDVRYGGNETEIGFVMASKDNKVYLKILESNFLKIATSVGDSIWK